MRENEIDISPLARALIKKFPHFAHILARLKLILSTKEKTAWIESDTDNIVKINPKFLREIQNLDDFPFVLMHETFHKILRHISRFKNFNAPNDLINYVTDARVNYILKKFFNMTTNLSHIKPESLWEILNIDEKQYLELTDEEIIKTLQAMQMRGKQFYIPKPHADHPWAGSQSQSSSQTQQSNQTQQVPTHTSTSQTSQTNSQQSSSQSALGDIQKQPYDLSSQQGHQQDNVPNQDAFNITDIIMAKQIFDKMRGKGRGEEFFDITRFIYKSKINWKRILRKIFATYYKRKKEDTYNPPDKKKWEITRQTKIIFPSQKPKKSMYSIFLIVDSSSSIRNDEFNTFICECLSLIKQYRNTIGKIYYIVFTDGISKFEVFDNPNIAFAQLSKFKRTRGGTDIDKTFYEIYEKAKQNRKILDDIKKSVWIVLSDGYFGDWGIDVIKSQKIKPRKVFFFITTMEWRNCPHYKLYRAYFLSV